MMQNLEFLSKTFFSELGFDIRGPNTVFQGEYFDLKKSAPPPIFSPLGPFKGRKNDLFLLPSFGQTG